MAPVSMYLYPSEWEIILATVLLPAPLGPSIVMIKFFVDLFVIVFPVRLAVGDKKKMRKREGKKLKNSPFA
jgi:hypothetical protein